MLFVFHETLHLHNYESADFEYKNSLFKFIAQKYPNKPFLIPNLKFSFFALNFAFGQI